MSFNQGSSSGTLSFAPARYNIKLGGSSAKVTFGLACPDTAATYSAAAYDIYQADGTAQCPYSTSATAAYSYTRGSRRVGFNAQCQVVQVSEVALPVTYSSGSVTVTFSVPAYDVAAWYLTATKSGVSRTVIVGRIENTGFDPYGAGGGTIDLVSNANAHKCI